MRASSRFTHFPLQVLSRRSAYTYSCLPSTTFPSSPSCKQPLHTRGFASTAEARLAFWVYSPHLLCFRSKVKQQDLPPFPPTSAHLTKAFCHIKLSALSFTSSSSSSCLEEKSYPRAPLNAQASVKDARKGVRMQKETGGHPDQGTSVQVVDKCVEERWAVSITACHLDGQSQESRQIGDTSMRSTVVGMPSQAQEEETAMSSETSIDNETAVGRSSPAPMSKAKAATEGEIFLRNVKISKRFKKNPDAVVTFLKINMFSKFCDLHGAIELYDKVKREGLVRLNIHSYNSLLYICSGAVSGVLEKAKKQGKTPESTNTFQPDYNETALLEETPKELVHFSPEDMELAMTKGADILEDMLQQGIEPNEPTYASIIRFAVAKNDGDLAFETIKLMASSGVPPKLRSYAPALICFCENNQVDKAFELDDHMQESGVLPDESMLHSLLKVSIEAKLVNQVYSLLQRLRMSVRDLMPETVTTIEKWFNSGAAASVGIDPLPSKEELRKAIEACGGGCHGLGWLGKGAWQVKRTNISKTGSCLSCGDALCTIDLEPEETEKFAASVANLAIQREQSPHGFKAFQNWLDKHGPFDAIIDGANVGLHNPKIYGGFSFKLLNAVVNVVCSKISPLRAPLVILHSRHKFHLAKGREVQIVSNKWRTENAMYFTPSGSNDDWFWLYAAVKCKGLLISNDRMRDHIFALLGNGFFPKWKERHQVQFAFTAEKLELYMPPPYSIVIQESERGSWHVPQAGGDDIEGPREWLCVTRPENVLSA